jgi:uncharacterized paraquat-inducible protein A
VNDLIKDSQAKKRSILLVILTFCFLILGISLPCIEVSSKLFGFLSVGTEKKSILGVLGNLLNSNILLGILVILFSIIIPVTKLGLTLFMIFSKTQNFNRSLQFLVHNIGKWSMVDVFSMSIIVAVLTFDNLKIKVFSTGGQFLPGFYFFLSYGILSILTTYFLNRRIVKINTN